LYSGLIKSEAKTAGASERVSGQIKAYQQYLLTYKSVHPSFTKGAKWMDTLVYYETKVPRGYIDKVTENHCLKIGEPRYKT